MIGRKTNQLFHFMVNHSCQCLNIKLPFTFEKDVDTVDKNLFKDDEVGLIPKDISKLMFGSSLGGIKIVFFSNKKGNRTSR